MGLGRSSSLLVHALLFFCRLLPLFPYWLLFCLLFFFLLFFCHLLSPSRFLPPPLVFFLFESHIDLIVTRSQSSKAEETAIKWRWRRLDCWDYKDPRCAGVSSPLLGILLNCRTYYAVSFWPPTPMPAQKICGGAGTAQVPYRPLFWPVLFTMKDLQENKRRSSTEGVSNEMIK